MKPNDAVALPVNQPDLSASHLQFLVVGIGASAGGLQALLSFFKAMPANSGMAFVVVLHLSPKYESLADDVLQRATAMPVRQVTATVPIEVNHVYIIAPNTQILMSDGELRVGPAERQRGQPVSIDTFFRALADVHKSRAVAIILSGTGADGSVGLDRIKEQGGITLAQDPGNAEYDGMPLAAIATGGVDFVLPVAEMPERLLELWASARKIELPPLGDGDGGVGVPGNETHDHDHERALQQILAMLSQNTGHDFQHYKRATVLRRIERRLQVKAITSLPEYVALLQQEPAEFKALLKDMLIGVTNFFRDREAFEAVERDVLPVIFSRKHSGDQVRVWVAACSTGQEAYSLAMLLTDQLEINAQPVGIQVFASDIDDQAIAAARRGAYPTSIVTDVPPQRLRQYFSQQDGRYCIRKPIRDRILFSAHNLLRDPPFSRLDMISCRNLLIYLNRDMQKRVMEMFHSALNPDGFLLLGSSESAESAAEFFTPFDKKNRIYRARTLARPGSYVPLLPRPSTVMPYVPALANAGTAMTKQFTFSELHHRALARFAPPSLVIDRDLDVVHVSEHAGQYLRYASGELSRSLVLIILPELRLELRTALYQAQQGPGRYVTQPVVVERGQDRASITMTVQRFSDSVATSEFVLVFFEETLLGTQSGAPPSGTQHSDLLLGQLEAELQRTKERLQETIEHSEVSFEELRASNEELQAINEELRSATEELETSKEELQSVNEELVTVNHELKLKVEETAKANDDLDNLIASTDIATIFVDRVMRIKRFTPRAIDIFNIIPTDIGRPLLDITHQLDYGQLADDVSATFDTLRMVERELRSHSGRHYIARILPYRTTDDKIDGAALTFFDVSGRREAEAKVRTGEEWMRLVAESTGDYAIMTVDSAGNVTGWNKGAEIAFGYCEAEMLGQPLARVFTPEDRELGVHEDEMRRARTEGRAEEHRWHVRKDGSRLFCQGVMTPLDNGVTLGYAKIARDYTHELQQENQRQAALNDEQHGRTVAENASAMKDEFLAVMSHELRHPLNLIYMNAELLSRLPQVHTTPPALRAVSLIRDAVSSQDKIISDLLDISRLSTGKLSLSCRHLRLDELISKWTEALKADPIVAALDLGCDLTQEPMLVYLDEIRMEQVVLNLLHNACKFTPAGGCVRVLLQEDGPFARLDVTDTGAGIPAQYLPRVFDMYEQGGSAAQRSASGLGIGLALVRQIVELHGGRVEAASPGAGMGSRFSLWLPLSPTIRPGVDDTIVLPANPLAGRRILLVDDMEDALYLFKELLEMDGAIVHVATSARRALEILVEHAFDLLLSDISMPEMDGYAFLRAVRAQAGLQALPAIAVSGLGHQKDLQMALDAGFTDYITKPVSVDTIRQKARKLIPAERSAQ